MDQERLERITRDIGQLIRVFHIMKSRGEASGIKPLPMDPQYLVLGLLKEGPLPISEIGRRLQRSKPNMSALIDRMIEEGFVRRLPDENDRRIVRVEMTGKGKSAVEERRKIAKECIEANLAPLSEEELERLCLALEEVNQMVLKAEKSTNIGRETYE